MPYASESQRRLMEGIAHGWKPSGMKDPPSKAVARKFTEHSEGKKTKLKDLLKPKR